MSIFLEIEDFIPTDWPVRHGFFGRLGGNSTGIYATLNCGLATNDPEALGNRAIVARNLGGNPDHLQSVYQVHGEACVYIREPVAIEQRPHADAMVTDVPGLILGILTADCGPILMCGQKKNGAPVVAAVHAGWKGALGGVLESTVVKMCEVGAQLPGIRAVVGPCIAKKSYEVSVGFENPFLKRQPQDEIFFHQSSKKDKLNFDLSGYIASRLYGCGVRYVRLADIDTVTNEQSYFSYRRATLQNEKENGRQMSAIMISNF